MPALDQISLFISAFLIRYRAFSIILIRRLSLGIVESQDSKNAII